METTEHPAEETVARASSTNGYKLRARDLGVYYGSFCAVKGLSLDIPAHQITALIGPSGCGKSTLLRTFNRMNDLLPNTRVEGNVFLDGESIFTSSTDVVMLRQRVGMVFQKPNPFPKTVYENVAYGPRIHGVKRRTTLDDLVERCLRRAALWDEVKDKLRQSALALSGGQQQRLCIARTLAVEPEVILMDEPCSALDPIATQHIEDLMIELKESYTIVIVTHNMQQAARVSDLTAFLLMHAEERYGELIEVGPSNELFTNPQNERTEAYVTGRFG
ncbi:MAG: phosphate ABC transporter ATP-binding protein [Armatimonadetes bacterium CG_4_10_14_3_um_filter_66_18]|nr:phosphate ABC transporter ATP-binding protein [Armatimonadota bacterium]OIO96333.1 MAG: phosphate ABC transporter ATP-binding protein [Armatimonadetes bacterium CG2_30_66_41]PIW17263.1 MAG: phosphate ABC transporter ATP-binding protein [Armatimonadetes bacterium CG17_big_fil_post_rev_8_21_14_2_50_66_6]PIX47143.1 MAG: phosphate ABC transporter ATP-binding protein [Armatimonadetes bacterium CG_4_8_14_3_um_filter_66_20]PIY50287.1 MAG: phosphate ABC transporter ATP-binding protein [Armatimonadet